MRDSALVKEREDVEERKGHAIDNGEYAGLEFSEKEFDERVNFTLHKFLLASKDEGK